MKLPFCYPGISGKSILQSSVMVTLVILSSVILGTVILCSGCGILHTNSQDMPEMLLKNEFNKNASVAVLTFSHHGSKADDGMDIGRFTSDRLSEKMFLSDSFRVVERSRVNEAIRFFGLKSLDELSLDEIQKLGLRLKADYLLTGDVRIKEKGSYLNYDTGMCAIHEGTITVSFRIISALNSDILGVVSYTADYDKSARDKLDSMINSIVEKMSAR